MAEGIAGTLSRQRAWQRQLLRSRWESENVAQEEASRDDDDAESSERPKVGKRTESRGHAEEAAAKAHDVVQSAEKAAKFGRTVIRVINGVEIVSFWGVLLAVITMHYQLVFGNLLHGAILPAPKLDWWEIAILFVLDVLIAVVVGFIIGLIMMILLLNPLNNIGPTAQQSNPGAWNPFDPTSKL